MPPMDSFELRQWFELYKIALMHDPSPSIAATAADYMLEEWRTRQADILRHAPPIKEGPYRDDSSG